MLHFAYFLHTIYAEKIFVFSSHNIRFFRFTTRWKFSNQLTDRCIDSQSTYKSIHYRFLAESYALPGCSAEGRHPRLQHPLEEPERVLSGDEEIQARKGDDSVNYEADDHRQHVHAELLSRQGQVGDRHDLAHDQGHDPDRRVPAIQKERKYLITRI